MQQRLRPPVNALISHFLRAWKWTNSFCLHQQIGNNPNTGPANITIAHQWWKEGLQQYAFVFPFIPFQQSLQLASSICFTASQRGFFFLNIHWKPKSTSNTFVTWPVLNYHFLFQTTVFGEKMAQITYKEEFIKGSVEQDHIRYRNPHSRIRCETEFPLTERDRICHHWSWRYDCVFPWVSAMPAGVPRYSTATFGLYS